MQVARRFRGIIAVGLFLLTIVSTATAQYGGGSGFLPGRPKYHGSDRRDCRGYGIEQIM